MALWHCQECTTAFAVGLPVCPHCGSTHYVEDGMPKITRHGGVSNAGAATEAGPEEEGVPSSPGSSSSTSPQKPATSQKTSGRDRHKRARTTASPSKQDQTEASTASGTAGAGPKTPASDDSSSDD